MVLQESFERPPPGELAIDTEDFDPTHSGPTDHGDSSTGSNRSPAKSHLAPPGEHRPPHLYPAGWSRSLLRVPRFPTVTARLNRLDRRPVWPMSGMKCSPCTVTRQSGKLVAPPACGGVWRSQALGGGTVPSQHPSIPGGLESSTWRANEVASEVQLTQ